MSRLNAFLDRLPRTRVGACSREGPAFRACGVTGFYLAVAAALAGGLLAGRELLVVLALCLACALSFFAYVYLRRWLTGVETLVLLEQVWTAEACCALALVALRAPVLPYLDVIAPAMALFLACGRVGCLLAGCCHGRPSALGIVYGEPAARDGFPRHLVGIRLFPVQAVEAAGLALIGLTGLAALPLAAPGRVFAWFLAGYGVLRFGTEGLRGDPRPHWLGISVPRWMALAEIGAAAWITRGGQDPLRDGIIITLLLLALAAGLAARRAFDARPALVSPAHADELRRAIAGGTSEDGIDAAGRALRRATALRDSGDGPDAAGSAVRRAAVGDSGDGDDATEPALRRAIALGNSGDGDHAAGPTLRVTSAGVAVAVSPAGAGWLHVSLSQPDAPTDLEALCQLAADAFPGLDPEGARAAGGVLHIPVRVASSVDSHASGDALYGAVVRRLQSPPDPEPEPVAEPAAATRGDYFGRARAAGSAR